MGCAGGFKSHNLPPAERLFAPGPGVAGPGPGVLTPEPVAQAVAVGGMMGGGPDCDVVGMVAASNSVQILFNRPESMNVRWDVGGIGSFDSDPLVVPGRRNFPEGGIYRLKITNIPGREGVELYPTLEIGPTTPRTAAYLAHNAIPVQFTEEDFDQVLSGNFVTKVIYLPDPEFQEMALAGVETLVSTRLDPGMDPIVEADRRGAIMAVIRLGNKDVEMPGGNADPVIAAGYLAQGAGCGPAGCGPAALPPDAYGYGGAPAFVAGVSAPQWGMPMSGTPIGLPGPPHIPFGSPAGLQKHVIRNHTHMHLPGPTEAVKVHVRQTPGYSYPKPASRVFIREQMIHPSLPYQQPRGDRTHVISDDPNCR
ncbi:MAG: hypothetical protein AB7F89_05105 [Pirellulaceae bacterium]